MDFANQTFERRDPAERLKGTTSCDTQTVAIGPKRIVCLTEEPTELLYALGQEDRIVGISNFTVRPVLEQAFARACQIGDPCWEGMSGRGLGLLAEAKGDTKQAFVVLKDAADRCRRLSDTYFWAEAYILDAQCSLGLVHGHEETAEWISKLYDLVTRTGMRELQVKAMLHRARLGTADEHNAAVNLAEDIANPQLVAMTTRPWATNES